MIEFKNIVVTTDLSENAAVAIPYAVDLAKKYGGTLTLLHVFEDTIYYAGTAAAEGMVVDIEEWAAKLRADRERQIQEKAQQLAASEKIPVIGVVRHGHGANEVINYAKEKKPDVVVIATHGRTGLQHLIFGSVAEKVIRLCPCPVLSVRPK